MLGFQSGIGYAGREGLQPTDSWLEIVKLEALAARQVAGELGVASVWSWGWGTFDSRRRRRRQGARRLHLPVDARSRPVRRAGPGRRRLQRARSTRGRSCSPPGVQCRIGTTDDDHDRRDRSPRARSRAAVRRRLGALLVRDLVKGRKATQLAIRRQEAAIIYGRFKSSRARYVAALATRGATPDVGRAAIADGLKLQTIERGLHVPAPTAAAVRAWRKAHGGTRVRLVTSSLPLGWLGDSRSRHRPSGQRRAAAGAARALRARRCACRRRRASRASRSAARSRCARRRAADANPAVSALIRATARDAAGATWLAGAASKALDTATCLRDQLPSADAAGHRGARPVPPPAPLSRRTEERTSAARRWSPRWPAACSAASSSSVVGAGSRHWSGFLSSTMTRQTYATSATTGTTSDQARIDQLEP